MEPVRWVFINLVGRAEKEKAPNHEHSLSDLRSLPALSYHLHQRSLLVRKRDLLLLGKSYVLKVCDHPITLFINILSQKSKVKM